MGIELAHALACTNATGMNHRGPDMDRRAAALMPIGSGMAKTCILTNSRESPDWDELRALLRALLVQMKVVMADDLG